MAQWTIETYVPHNEALRAAEKELQAERDRRYAEVALEKEKALRIKEEADKVALALARDIQTYKDMKANELREQIASERGLYATKNDLQSLGEKFDASHKPVVEFMATAIGNRSGTSDTRVLIAWAVALLVGLISIGTFVFRSPAVPIAPQIIYVPAQPGTLIPTQPPQK